MGVFCMGVACLGVDCLGVACLGVACLGVACLACLGVASLGVATIASLVVLLHFFLSLFQCAKDMLGFGMIILIAFFSYSLLGMVLFCQDVSLLFFP